MPINETILAERLRDARVASGLSQEQVAGEIGVPRSAIAQIERGRRNVGSIELGRLAAAYGRTVGDFLTESFEAEGTLVALFRASGRPLEDPETAKMLRRYAGLARQFTNLENLLGVNRGGGNVRYSIRAPRSKAEAVTQGSQIAEQERSRLSIGLAPVADLCDLLNSHGVRTALVDLPDAVSGLTLVDADTGPLVIANRRDPRLRRRFSLAHEYCHALLDCDRRAQISFADEGQDLLEVRANAFAASLLMPSDGVLRYLDGMGKGRGSVGAAGHVQLNDLVLLAHHFDVSRNMASHRLHSMGVIGARAAANLREEDQARGNKVARLLGLHKVEDSGGEDQFHPRLLNLALDAYLAGEISRSKLDEIYRAVLGRGVKDDELPPQQDSGI